ncbi:MAG: hypothetical protein NVSMB9_06520 [Isosphaeraceae bacterium]
MDRSKRRRGLSLAFRPRAERVEERVLLSHGGGQGAWFSARGGPGHVAGAQPVRPNTPVLPFGAPLATATFIDPSVHLLHGAHTTIGQRSYVGPYATLDATTGFLTIGSGSDVLDNARIVTNPRNLRTAPSSVWIGDSVSIGYGATVLGPSTIGAFGPGALPTSIGPNALIDGATIAPGASVGPLARVGPGVTVPSSFYVLPGASVDSDAEASNPALGKVVKVPDTVAADVLTTLARSSALAAGYTNLYQGNPATGANPGVQSSVAGVFNGNLAAVSGASREPGPTSATAPTGITFEPGRAAPRFPGPHLPQVESEIPSFRARVTGDVRFGSRAHTVNRHFGRGNSVRGDQGQPITFATNPSTGTGVTIQSPLGGTVTTGGTSRTVGGIQIGRNFRAENGAVLLGGPDAAYTIGDDVSLGSEAVVDRSSLGQGSTIGARSYISRSIVPPNTDLPPGTILIQNKVVGRVQW